MLEYDDVMNQQRQVVYDIRNQALSGNNMRDSVYQVLDDFIFEEIKSQTDSKVQYQLVDTSSNVTDRDEL